MVAAHDYATGVHLGHAPAIKEPPSQCPQIASVVILSSDLIVSFGQICQIKFELAQIIRAYTLTKTRLFNQEIVGDFIRE